MVKLKLGGEIMLGKIVGGVLGGLALLAGAMVFANSPHEKKPIRSSSNDLKNIDERDPATGLPKNLRAAK